MSGLGGGRGYNRGSGSVSGWSGLEGVVKLTDDSPGAETTLGKEMAGLTLKLIMKYELYNRMMCTYIIPVQ